tara:strand:+ start:28 stop:681 length:654 start_codon:yes stop_codon:yes gene_type:complete
MGDDITLPTYVKNNNDILNTANYTHESSVVYPKVLGQNNLQQQIRQYQNELSDISTMPNTNLSDANAIKTKLTSIQKNMGNFGINDVVKYYKKTGVAAQTQVENDNPKLKQSSAFLNNQVVEAQQLKEEIIRAKASREIDKLQSKSYWMQSLVLLVIFLIFIWRIIAATYTNKTGVLDLVMAIISIVVLLYTYWNSIWGPIVNYWNYLTRTIFNINI